LGQIAWDMDQITVSRLLVRFMEALGIRDAFGIPGAHILPLYDALRDSSVRPVLTKHEQGAAFMAGGAARAAGGVSACVATAGPGATNLATGLANAYADRLPVLALTGETPTYSFGRGALQESSGQGNAIDQTALFAGITRYNRIVERTDYLLQVLAEAALRLLSPVKPGPVLLSVPYNIARETVSASLLGILPDITRRSPVPRPAPEDLDMAAEAVLRARRPVVVAGHGAAGSTDMLEKFSKRLAAPVATTLKAKGIIPETGPLALGTLGITSGELARRYIGERADLVILLGASFGERTSYNWNEDLLRGKSLIRVDRDEHRLFRAHRADLTVRGDSGLVLKGLLDRIPDDCGAVEDGQLEEYRRRFGDRGLDGGDFGLVREVLERAAAAWPTGTLVFDDNILYIQNFLDLDGAVRYFPNSGISSLGHAVPAGIGAAAATGRPTVAFLGDGGFQMCGMELMTAVNHDFSLNVILLNNSTLGLVRKNQHYNYGGRFVACDFKNPDYELLARSFGIEYHSIRQKEDCALLETINWGRGVRILDVHLGRDEFPSYSSAR